MHIISAKHGVALLRAWRWMSLIVGLRCGLTLIAAINLALTFTRPGWVGFTAGEVFTTLVSILMVVALCLIYIIEPFWRLYAVTALGVAISARSRQASASVLAAGGAVALMWLGQGGVVVAVGLVVSIILFPLGMLESSVFRFVICAPWLLVALIALSVYGFYSLVQTWSLRRAEAWLARRD
jgi:hypothetical protein